MPSDREFFHGCIRRACVVLHCCNGGKYRYPLVLIVLLTCPASSWCRREHRSFSAAYCTVVSVRSHFRDRLRDESFFRKNGKSALPPRRSDSTLRSMGAEHGQKWIFPARCLGLRTIQALYILNVYQSLTSKHQPVCSPAAVPFCICTLENNTRARCSSLLFACCNARWGPRTRFF